MQHVTTRCVTMLFTTTICVPMLCVCDSPTFTLVNNHKLGGIQPHLVGS